MIFIPSRFIPFSFLLIVTLSMTACGPRLRPSDSPSKSGAMAGNGPVSPGNFVDITESAGIRYQWQIPGKRPLNLLQTIGNGCAFLDYDGDGNLDILLVGPQLAVYRGDGKGQFVDTTRDVGLDKLQGAFLGCATGDYDNDGFTDIYLSGYRTGLLLHNEAGRRFQDVTRLAGLKPQPWGTSCAFGDVDGDGKLDLYIGNYVKFGPDTIPQLCTRGGKLTACGPLSYQPEFGVLYRNQGQGRFVDVTRAWGADSVSGKALGVAFAPQGFGGKQSLAIGNDEMPGDLLIRSGNRFMNEGKSSGTAYSAEGKPHGGMGVDWGDYDNDGRLDLGIATFDSEAKPIFRNVGNNYYEDLSQSLGIADRTFPYVAFGLKWLDFDNDGWLDLMITNGHTSDNIAEYDSAHTYRQPSQLFKNLQGTRFEDVGAQAGSAISKLILGRGLAIGDIDNDGRVDALLADSEGKPVLLHNQTTSVGHWLEIRLVGVKCNRDGFGSIVTVDTGTTNGKWIRHCHTDGSYLSASDPRVHFGLGTSSRASITVQWPNGHVDRYPDVMADHVMTLREGGVVVPTPPTH